MSKTILVRRVSPISTAVFLGFNGDFRFLMENVFPVFYSANFIEQLKSIWRAGKSFHVSHIRRTVSLRRQFQLRVFFIVLERHFPEMKIPANLLHVLLHSSQITNCTAEGLRNDIWDSACYSCSDFPSYTLCGLENPRTTEFCLCSSISLL